MIEVTRHELVLRNIPPQLEGLRIVQLTDIHRSKMTEDALIKQAVKTANDCAPDLILLTGDYVSNQTSDIAPMAHMLSHLKARLGKYAILGNHDHHTDGSKVAHALMSAGIEVFQNQNVFIDGGLRIVGVDDDRYYHTDIQKAMRGVLPDEPMIVMAHNPALVEKLHDRECVVLSGHTHGGQIRVPLLTAREVRRIGAKHYRAGWFEVGKARLYVCRGIGCVGMKMRLFCPPEIAVFEVKSARA